MRPHKDDSPAPYLHFNLQDHQGPRGLGPLTAGGQDHRSLGGGHEGLDGGQEARVVIQDDVHLLEQDERRGRLLAVLLAGRLRGAAGWRGRRLFGLLGFGSLMRSNCVEVETE